MRAVVITGPGGLEVLGVADREVRHAGPGEVRIAVKAAAVNPTDIGLRENGAGDELQPPWVPGMDAAGTVESVGAGVDRLAVGEQVMAAVSPRRPEGGGRRPSSSSCPRRRWCGFPRAPRSPRPRRCQ
jgi:NADPH2:quinone reductase